LEPKELVKAGYDAIANVYASKRHENLPEMRFLPEFSDYIPLNGKVLDLGCGSGIPFSKYLSKRFEVTGIDISPNQIKLAKINVPQGRFYCGDMTSLKFPDNSFNGMLAFYSIIHVPRKEHYSLFCDMVRILKRNGVALINLHSTDDPESINNDFFGTSMFWSGYDWKINEVLLQEAGFTILWSKIVKDSLDTKSQHLFVLGKK